MATKTARVEGRGRPDLTVFGVVRSDPGSLYILEHGRCFKIGKTGNPERRMREARTWIPDIRIVGIKPFWGISDLERLLHCGLAQFWTGGEWFEFPDDSYGSFFEGFDEFYDDDPDWNSVDFIYWFSSSGMGELVMEQNHRRISLKRWLRVAGSGWQKRIESPSTVEPPFCLPFRSLPPSAPQLDLHPLRDSVVSTWTPARPAARQSASQVAASRRRGAAPDALPPEVPPWVQK